MPNTNYVLPENSGHNFSNGIHELFLYVNEQVPIFVPTLLFSIFLFIFLTGSTQEYFRRGDTEIMKWATVASLITSGTATFFTFITGLVTLDVLVITYTITALFTLIYFTTK